MVSFLLGEAGSHLELSPAFEHTGGSWISCFPRCTSCSPSLGVHILQLFSRYDKVRSQSVMAQMDLENTERPLAVVPSTLRISSCPQN